MAMWTDAARRQYQRLGTRYASDLTDEELALIEPMLPAVKRGGRRRTTALREVLNAILYLLRTGCQWRMLPKEFPPRSTVYEYFRQFWQLGTWKHLWMTLLMAAREQAGKEASPTAAIIDSQSVKTTESGGIRGYDAGKKFSAENVICSRTRSACRSCWWFMPPTSRTEMAWLMFAVVSAAASRGWSWSSRMAAIKAIRPPVPPRKNGSASRSSSGRATPEASTCCHDAGSSSAPSPGLAATGGWPRKSRN
jgi:transposase